MKKDINQKWFFNQPPPQVWDYLTKAELLALWLMDNDFKPVVGHKFQFRGGGHDCETVGIAYCEVLEIVPQKRLSYSWRTGSGNDMTVNSMVIWTLSEKPGGTELLLQHNGFELLEDYQSHADGWNRCMNQLNEILIAPQHASATT
ncbi:MAG: polyketide cyclase [Bacteroidetes bacterium]|nr:MAG: polyketide cyclase [Bacteroidota bacterium]